MGNASDESASGVGVLAEAVAPDALFGRVASILEQARGNVVRAVNHNMVVAYWLIGREIVMELQRGHERAGYGEYVIRALSARLTSVYGTGYSVATLKTFRQFYAAYSDRVIQGNDEVFVFQEQGRAIGYPPGSQFDFHWKTELSWSHYRALMRVEDRSAREYYEREAAAVGWTKIELERQIHTRSYERLVATQARRGTKPGSPELLDKSTRDMDALSSASSLHAPVPVQAAELSTPIPTQAAPSPLDTLKDPYVQEFLDIPYPAAMHETGLEGAIIAHLRDFLLELGKGFAFVARQKRLSFEDQHLYVDLVFYSIPLRCYLLFDLKTGKLTHADVGQMDGYVRMFDDLMAGLEDNPTIGLILCTEHNSAVARYSILNDRRQIFASRYMTCLPTEAELAAEIQRTRALLENHSQSDARQESDQMTARGDSTMACKHQKIRCRMCP